MSVDFGRPSVAVRTRWTSGRLDVRLWAVSAALGALAVVVALLALGVGDYPLAPARVLGALGGALTGADGVEQRIVVGWRLPVAVAAVVLGALLGLGGAVFQSLTRNPLGSPDVIGFDAGAYTAVVVTVLVVGATGYWTTAAAALAGGLATAALVYVLAHRGGVGGFRLVVVGIGVSAVLGSVNGYLITRADVEDAMTVGFWGAGSLARLTWASVLPALALAAGVALACAALAPALRRLEVGDDAAVALGTRVGPARLGLLVVGVAATALVTAAAGPIGFVALAAPQVARRLTRSPGVSPLAAAATGAALLSCAHLASLGVAQVFRPVPVGLITVCLGGAYMIGLLVREARRRGGALW
ncbi:FecCD family ABC transporter permease [Quadrisphaera oryzae]|uniref:FecCD family ABC transporter permease n=1 Tax=Quadrisphaera TaxID=317661 RepID=UPI001645B0DE|nr:iron chelate uptake ABC transporter family permease subunit [Quadrisphaera sp. RL12-1S]